MRRLSALPPGTRTVQLQTITDTRSARIERGNQTVAITKPTITIDGNFSDWVASELITTPSNFVPGYSLYGTVQNDSYFIAIDAALATDPVIGAGTTIWLNTDQNTAAGSSPFGSTGAEYTVTYVNGSFYLSPGAAAQTLVRATALTAALS